MTYKGKTSLDFWDMIFFSGRGRNQVNAYEKLWTEAKMM